MRPANPKRPRCEARNAAGEPCGMAPLEGARFCFTHDPRRGRERALARKRGGRNRQTPSADRSAREPVSLRDVASIQRILETVIADTLLQENSAQRSRAIGALLSIALTALEVGELEGRMAAIERGVAARLGPQLAEGA